jgi:hypothetical protein
MGDVERTLRHERNFRFILAHTSRTWALGLVAQLRELADKKDREGQLPAAAAAAVAAAAPAPAARA